MARLNYLTAGESHGEALVGIIEGMPALLRIDASDIDYWLKLRQQGYGRSRRQTIEDDKVKILSGVRNGATIGSPIALLIPNKDWVNWQSRMAVEPEQFHDENPVTIPRPGHADFAGAVKYG